MQTLVVLRAVLLVAGEVNDVNTTAVAELFAALLSVPLPSVTVTATAASVHLQVDVTVPESSAAAGEASLSTELATAADATTFLSPLSLAVTTAPVVSTVEADASAATPAPPTTNDSVIVVVGAAAGGLVALILVVLAATTLARATRRKAPVVRTIQMTSGHAVTSSTSRADGAADGSGDIQMRF